MDVKLEIELVPATVWETSLAKLLPRELWNNIRNGFIEKNGRKCQICGQTEGVMNLHEIWGYDDRSYIQKLEGFILLCAMCHHVKHMGLTGILARQGKLNLEDVIDHFCKVNDCSKNDFEIHRKESFETFRKRSSHQWKQDFGEYREYVKK